MAEELKLPAWQVQGLTLSQAFFPMEKFSSHLLNSLKNYN